MTPTHDGRSPIEKSGFSYLPGIISTTEADALIAYFASIQPLWEQRHRGEAHERNATHSRRLTRPVYWLGAWQFACLGYYAEPLHRENRCVRAEPIPGVMQGILERLAGPFAEHVEPGYPASLPNTCLINYYGRDQSSKPPRDYARLRMHRDHEPGPVIMFSIGQPALLEFLDPERSEEPELALWMRHRSICIISGSQFKDRLYHRITQVRGGALPAMSARLAGFALRRVSVSFRSVPNELIKDLGDLPPFSQALIEDYATALAEGSEHWRAQLVSDPEVLKSRA